MNEEELIKLKQAAHEQNIIDLIFIMDFTGSMKKWMDSCKSQIKGVIEAFKEKNNGCTLKIGIVGYRDVKDKQKLAYHDLTNDVNMITSFIAKQEAKGGGDDAEDVCSGIEKAMSFNISKNPSSILVTILFADAPCHGKQYHDGVEDKLANKVPPNTLENLMRKYSDIKRNNYFTCVNITKKTNKMYQIMKQNFLDLYMAEQENSENFDKLVQFTLENSLKKTLEKSQYQSHFQKPKPLSLKDYLENSDNDRIHFWQINAYEEEGSVTRSGDTVLQFFENDIVCGENEQGQISRVYKFYDCINNLYIIIKVPKIISEMDEKKQQPSQEFIQQTEKEAIVRYQNQVRARWLAQIYRYKTSEINGAPPVFFPLPILYTLKNKKFKGLQKLYGEVYIDLPQIQWQKYSSNGVYLDKEYYFYSSFSHFVFEETKRWFTFTDLQGKRNLLSDPAIQTVNNYNSSSQAAIENLGVDGIKYFLIQHEQCSFICKQLRLKEIDKETETNIQKWESKREDGKIDIFCEKCDTQIEITLDEYKQKGYEMCKECEARQPDIRDAFCSCCREVFQIRLSQGMKEGTNINTCGGCKMKCGQVSEKKCRYCNMKCMSFLKTVDIGGTSIDICRKGFNYLEQLQCSNCKENYHFKIILEKNEYKDGKFYCGGQNCKKAE